MKIHKVAEYIDVSKKVDDLIERKMSEYGKTEQVPYASMVGYLTVALSNIIRDIELASDGIQFSPSQTSKELGLEDLINKILVNINRSNPNENN